MSRLFATIATTCSLTACATMGNPVYQQEYSLAIIGKSTIAEVRKYFGHPTELLVSSDGTSEMIWQWSESETKATSFIPFAAYVGGAGATGTTTKIVARFGADGVLRELLRGGATVDITSGTVMQGYKSVGEQKATPGELAPMPTTRPGTGARCDKESPCEGRWMRCVLMEGKDYGYCMGTAPTK